MSKIISDIRPRIIFVGGVHGVGKTTLCGSLYSQFNIEHHSASKLIAKINEKDLSSDKLVKNIQKNQDALIISINEYLEPEKNYIIDGHFCLLNSKGFIERIPLSTYELMNLIGIIVLFDDPLNINKRLDDRDKMKFDINLLSRLQDEETSYAKYISEYLKTPFIKVNPFLDNKIISEFISNFI